MLHHNAWIQVQARLPTAASRQYVSWRQCISISATLWETCIVFLAPVSGCGLDIMGIWRVNHSKPGALSLSVCLFSSQIRKKVIPIA